VEPVAEEDLGCSARSRSCRESWEKASASISIAAALGTHVPRARRRMLVRPWSTGPFHRRPKVEKFGKKEMHLQVLRSFGKHIIKGSLSCHSHLTLSFGEIPWFDDR